MRFYCPVDTLQKWVDIGSYLPWRMLIYSVFSVSVNASVSVILAKGMSRQPVGKIEYVVHDTARIIWC